VIEPTAVDEEVPKRFQALHERGTKLAAQIEPGGCALDPWEGAGAIAAAIGGFQTTFRLP